jgi:hypothetical protein
MTWNPVVAGKELDLYVLYHEVCKQGGVEAVVKSKRWKRVRCTPPCVANPRRPLTLVDTPYMPLERALPVPAPWLGNGAPCSRSAAADARVLKASLCRPSWSRSLAMTGAAPSLCR